MGQVLSGLEDTCRSFLQRDLSAVDIKMPAVLRHRCLASSKGLLFTQQSKNMIELMPSTSSLRSQVPSVIGIDRRLKRHPSCNLDTGLGKALLFRRIIR